MHVSNNTVEQGVPTLPMKCSDEGLNQQPIVESQGCECLRDGTNDYVN